MTLELPPSVKAMAEASAALPDVCCAHCVFFVSGPNPTSNLGQCRRRAPVPILLGMVKGALGNPTPIVDGFVPMVGVDFWCGEFDAKVEKVKPKDTMQ